MILSSPQLAASPNVSKNDYFDSFVSINNVANNGLSFLYDNQEIEISLPLNSAIICTEKVANKLKPNQKNLLFIMFKNPLQKYPIFSTETIQKKKVSFDTQFLEIVVILVIMLQLKMV